MENLFIFMVQNGIDVSRMELLSFYPTLQYVFAKASVK